MGVFVFVVVLLVVYVDGVCVVWCDVYFCDVFG